LSRHTAGSLVIATCALSWGTIALVVREVELPALSLVFFRVAFSALSLAGILLLIGRAQALRPPPPVVAALGVLLAIHWGLYFASIKETSVASAVLVTYVAPVFMALLAPVLIRERITGVTVGALAVSLGGIALISLAGGEGSGEVRAFGVALAVGAAITYALLVVLIKRWAADVDPLTFVVYQDLTAAVVLAPSLLAASWSLTGTEIGYLILLGGLLTGVAGAAYVGALRHVPATNAGILAYLEPLSAAVLAAIFLSEPLTGAVLAGGAAIVAAGVAVILAAPAPVPASIEGPVPAPRARSRITPTRT
jgi:drug/metabolite transporter (DMT)-like permease